MTRMLAIVAITGASKVLKQCHETLSAAGYLEAARHVHQAGELVRNALGLVVVERAQAASS